MHESVTRTAEFISQSARGGLNRFGLEAAAHNSQSVNHRPGKWLHYKTQAAKEKVDNYTPLIPHIFAWKEAIFIPKQECIPVGCIPSAAVAVCLGGVSTQGGICLGGGLPCGVCKGGVCPGVSAHEGVCPEEGVCPGSLPRGMSATRLWKHYLSATSFVDGKKSLKRIQRNCLTETFVRMTIVRCVALRIVWRCKVLGAWK